MADEIAQVVEMEYKGVYYAFKGTKATIAAIVSAIKALAEWKHEKYLNKPGNCDWKKMQEISKGTPPLLEFPKEMFEEKMVGREKDGTPIMKSDFDLYCEKYDLRYCIMPDLNPSDDYIPVAVPAQDMGIHQEQIKAVMNRRIQTEEDKDKEYDEKIAELKERIKNAEGDMTAAKEELAMLELGKSQNQELLVESKEKLEKDNVLDFAEYLRQGKGTLMETDPTMALTQENVCGIVKEFTPYECMFPIRDESLVPDSKEIYYSQRTSDDKIHVIKRRFLEDEHGNIYSEYSVRLQGSSDLKRFDDKGKSKEEWEKELPKVLEAGGFINDEPTAVSQSEERFLKYQEFLERNFKKAPEEGQEKAEVYSNEEAKEFVEGYAKEKEMGQVYEESLYTTVAVPASKIMADGEQVVCMELTEGLVKGVMVESMDDVSARVFVKEDAVYSVVKPDGQTKEMTGADIVAEASKSAKEELAKAIAKGR